jgi:hypothetical protein
MEDNTELKILDELLRYLLETKFVKYGEIWNDTFINHIFLKTVDPYTYNFALLKLAKDEYVLQNKKDNGLINSEFHITFEGIIFIKKGGYCQERLEAQRKEKAYELLKIEQKRHETSLLSLNRRMVLLTKIIAFGTFIAAVYYLLEILSFFWRLLRYK